MCGPLLRYAARCVFAAPCLVHRLACNTMPKGAVRMPKPKKTARNKPPPKKPTAEELYVQAQIALQYDDCESALDALRQAVQLEPRNLEMVEAYGSLLAESGDEEQAITMLRRAIEISPDAGYEKFMYLGQLLEGEEALGMTRRGIDLLQAQLDKAVSSSGAGEEEGAGPAGASGRRRGGKSSEVMEAEADEEEGEEGDEEPSVPELQQQLCSALCSLAEALMNQAEDVESVALEVEGLLARAQATCVSSPEPGQALASLRYEQQRAGEALEVLRESMKRWFKRREEEDEDEEDEEEEMEDAGKAGKGKGKGKGKQEDDAGDSGDELGEASARRQRESGLAEPSGRGEDEDMEDGEEDAVPPSYEFRFECAKLLLELDDSTEDAIQVLEDLVEEDDSNPHTWHLLGMAYYGGHMLDEAQEIHDKGLKLLKKLKVPEDEEVYDDYADLQDAVQHARTVMQA